MCYLQHIVKPIYSQLITESLILVVFCMQSGIQEFMFLMNNMKTEVIYNDGCSKDRSALVCLSTQRAPAQNYQRFVQISSYPHQSCGTDCWWPSLWTDRQNLSLDLLSHSLRKTQIKLSAAPIFPLKYLPAATQINLFNGKQGQLETVEWRTQFDGL